MLRYGDTSSVWWFYVESRCTFHIFSCFEDGYEVVDSFCGGLSKKDGVGEDSGWTVSWVHNEETDVSQVCVIDAQKFEGEPVAKITLPQRVPYGFHGTFVLIPN
ncbi:hypothetical protein NL676_013381 [Syzygium grande]|nr:hypothetical protein NL676_013381 [Syzygium grande]